jgi:hypothetical protein
LPTPSSASIIRGTLSSADGFLASQSSISIKYFSRPYVFLRVCFRGKGVLVLVVFHYHICRPIGFISEGKLLDYVGVLVLGRVAGR